MLNRRDTLRIGAAGLAYTALGRAAFGAADTVKTPVGFDVPANACDCHVHVFGDPAKFPFAADRVYTPPGASIEMLQDLHKALHVSRVVVVNPSVYGTDNSCTLDAVRHIGPTARAVVVIGKDTPRAALDEMAAAGARGVRVNLTTGGTSDPQAAGAIIVWGTDWPHPNPTNQPRVPVSEITRPAQVDDGLVLNQLAKWVPDAATRKKILVDNPARLYGFSGVG